MYELTHAHTQGERDREIIVQLLLLFLFDMPKSLILFKLPPLKSAYSFIECPPEKIYVILIQISLPSNT